MMLEVNPRGRGDIDQLRIGRITLASRGAGMRMRSVRHLCKADRGQRTPREYETGSRGHEPDADLRHHAATIARRLKGCGSILHSFNIGRAAQPFTLQASHGIAMDLGQEFGEPAARLTRGPQAESAYALSGTYC